MAKSGGHERSIVCRRADATPQKFQTKSNAQKGAANLLMRYRLIKSQQAPAPTKSQTSHTHWSESP